MKRKRSNSLKKGKAGKGLPPVAGDGPVPCDLMIIGEAPGRVETALGKPFVGRAGRFFMELATGALHRPRESFYITNVVKFWPKIGTKRGKTRPPSGKEITESIPFLLREIELVSPSVIIAAGKTAYRALKVEGEFSPGRWEKKGRHLIMPVYHPSYILRMRKKELAMGLAKALGKVRRRLRG